MQDPQGLVSRLGAQGRTKVELLQLRAAAAQLSSLVQPGQYQKECSGKEIPSRLQVTKMRGK